jgi:hypothetical protein
MGHSLRNRTKLDEGSSKSLKLGNLVYHLWIFEKCWCCANKNRKITLLAVNNAFFNRFSWLSTFFKVIWWFFWFLLYFENFCKFFTDYFLSVQYMKIMKRKLTSCYSTHFLFQKACLDICIVRKNQFRKSWKQLLIFKK